TNNLDRSSRAALHHEISQYKGCLLLASHDRELLRLMDHIVELTPKGLDSYGGNFDFYLEQKAIMENAEQQQLHSTMERLQQAKRQQQQRVEKHQKNVSKGKRVKKAMIAAKGRVDRIELNSKKGRSEKTQRRIGLEASKKQTVLNTQLREIKDNMIFTDELVITMSATRVAKSKQVLQCSDVSFGYGDKVLFKEVNLTLQGPERVAIIGDNGTGKTTLFKLVTQQLTPDTGDIQVGVERIHYCDQHAQSLQHELTVLDNFMLHNPDITEAQAYSILAQFLFRKQMLFTPISALSGGEKIRAQLACVLMSPKAPQLLLLDEPTNHIDLASLAVIESALRSYQGALLVISHDHSFLENIAIERDYQLNS
ncbi:MAG: ABC-F family ATP-binding cassette domain-containing protein, partial [Coxiellaceae bacterium]|nr:ABC-F family ATP-binding cassette domain-containing protein [Coxiellaceae bacterium]